MLHFISLFINHLHFNLKNSVNYFLQVLALLKTLRRFVLSNSGKVAANSENLNNLVMARYTTEKTPLGVRVYGTIVTPYLFFSHDPKELYEWQLAQGRKNPVLGRTFDEWVASEGLTAKDFTPPMPDTI